MTENFDYKGVCIRYSERGHGKNIVLLHGYLESLNIFERFAANLSQKYKVITLDLPGHGKSDLINQKCSMEVIADMLYELIKYLRLDKINLFGHSMGGYAALAFAEKYSNFLESFGLFHSTPNPDTDEKKRNRKREIELIRKGKKEFLCKNSIPKMFFENNQIKFSNDINRMINIACNTRNKGIIAALEGMMNRKDRNEILRKLKVPKISFIGKYDSFIPYETALSTAKNNKMQPIVLDNSGHIGFVEQQEECLNKIFEFL